VLTHRSRGQVLPIWTMAIAAALVLAFAALQYGQVLRWQIRAQNAADAAAAGALSVQSSAWNQQMMLVYAAGVEEYRIKQLLAGMRLASNDDTTCQPRCWEQFVKLRDEFKRAVDRYTTDVQKVNRVSQYSQAQAQSDARAIVADFQTNCGKINGGDCAFSYNVTNVRKRVGSLNDVRQAGGVWWVNTNTTLAAPNDDYTPSQIEVVVCADVAPLVPSVLGFKPPVFRAVGRAAATTAMVTQEWIQPGIIVDPRTGKPFQPVETYEVGTPATKFNKQWYDVNFGGNDAIAVPKNDAYFEFASAEEFSAATGWWSSIPIKPYTGSLGDGAYACKAAE
jgi:cytochrome c556